MPISPLRPLDVALTSRLRQAIEDALQRIGHGLDGLVLDEALATGVLSTAALHALLRIVPSLLQQAAAAPLLQAVQEASLFETGVLQSLGVLQANFVGVNALASRIAAMQGAALVTRITETTRENLRRVVALSIREGLPPREAAKLIRPLVPLTPVQSQAVVSFRSRLLGETGQVSTAADARVDSAVERYARRLLTQRAEMIARTEIIDALTRGQQATWQQSLAAGYLKPGAKQVWIVTDDDRLCPLCQRMSGRLAAIGGWFATPLGRRTGPPLHPHCRCAVALHVPSLQLPRAA